MKMTKLFSTAALVFAATGVCSTLHAAGSIDAEDFVEEASAKSLAEIETARTAIQKTESAVVREFAQAMIADHTKANQELKRLANAKKLDVADDAELMNQAKAFILKQRDGESFDEAYANNQVVAHEQSIELFKKAAMMKDAELKAFAQKTLPKLEHHLQMAQELAMATGASEVNDDSSNHESGRGSGTGTGGTDIDNDAGPRTNPNLR